MVNMISPRYKRSTFLACLLLLLVLLVPVVLTWREWRQMQLDHALIAHIKANDADAVIEDLRRGADPNVRNIPASETNGWKRMQDVLLHRQPDAKEKLTAFNMIFLPEDTQIVDPVNLCPHCQNTRLVVALLDAGADPNIPLPDGTPVLVNAAWPAPLPVLKALLTHHACVNATDKIGLTALHQASSAANVNLLLEYGANINALDAAQETPLFYAVASRNFEVIESLLQHHANVNIPSHEETPLHRACRDGATDIVRLLEKAGAKSWPQEAITR